MNGAKALSPERIAEIKAFKNTDFSDCPVMTTEELKKLRPRHSEYFRQKTAGSNVTELVGGEVEGLCVLYYRDIENNGIMFIIICVSDYYICKGGR